MESDFHNRPQIKDSGLKQDNQILERKRQFRFGVSCWNSQIELDVVIRQGWLN